MTFGAVDIPTHSGESLRNGLNALESKLAAAKAQRDQILIDVRKASAAADMGDQRARFAQGGLNKEDAAAGRLILSLEAQVTEARKRLAMAMNQVAVIEAKSRAADMAAIDTGLKFFEVTTPDGREVRHRAESLDALRKALLPNYVVRGQIFGADADGKGGFMAPIGSSAPTIMTSLLDAFGDQLLAWLASRGVKTTAA
jgi:hypothetical protein